MIMMTGCVTHIVTVSSHICLTTLPNSQVQLCLCVSVYQRACLVDAVALHV